MTVVEMMEKPPGLGLTNRTLLQQQYLIYLTIYQSHHNINHPQFLYRNATIVNPNGAEATDNRARESYNCSLSQ
jgi:hypothetical protein